MYELKTRAKFFENGAPVLIFSTISTRNQDFQGKKEYTYRCENHILQRYVQLYFSKKTQLKYNDDDDDDKRPRTLDTTDLVQQPDDIHTQQQQPQ